MNNNGRRLIGLTATITVLLALASCGTGFDAQTSQRYQAGVGSDHRTAKINVLGTMFVANTDGTATLSASIVNNSGQDAILTTVKVEDAQGTPLAVQTTRFLMPLPNSHLTRIGVVSDAGGYIVTDGAEPGYNLRVTLEFSPGKPITLTAPVVTRTSDHDSVASKITTS